MYVVEYEGVIKISWRYCIGYFGIRYFVYWIFQFEYFDRGLVDQTP